jgi:VanZ family protein
MGSFFSRIGFPIAILSWLPALYFASIIFAFSATPGDEVAHSYDNVQNMIRGVSPSVATTMTVSNLKVDWLKIGHGIGYFCLGVSVLFALPGQALWSPGIALILCSLYSVTDEIHQIFIPGRTASPRDILIDTLAALGGVALMMGIRLWKKAGKQSE